MIGEEFDVGVEDPFCGAAVSFVADYFYGGPFADEFGFIERFASWRFAAGGK